MISGWTAIGPGDAQPLVLAAGKSQGRLVQAVLDLVPQGGPVKALFHRLVQRAAVADAGDPQAVGDVLVDRLGKGRRPLEDHAHLLPQFDHVGRAVEDLLAVHEDAAGGADVVDQVVHAVQAAQQGRLAAARGTDQGRDLVAGEVDGNILQGLAAAVEEAQVVHLDDRVSARPAWRNVSAVGRAATSILRTSGMLGGGLSIVGLMKLYSTTGTQPNYATFRLISFESEGSFASGSAGKSPGR